MNILPLRNSFTPLQSNKANNQLKNNTQTPKRNTQVSFKSIFADANGDNYANYAYFINANKDFRNLKTSSTRIFRELSAQNAISKTLNPNQKNEIKILGCSDGSEAWAYAIACKEAMGDKAQDSVQINAIDIQPYMVNIAKSGRIVCSDVEKQYANNTGKFGKNASPIKGDNWSKYLIESTRPEEFSQTLSKYPLVRFMEIDPASRKEIGNGLNWYEINKTGLPQVTFTQGDMMENLQPSEDSDSVVYVVANTAGYLLEESFNSYVNLFAKIKEANKNNRKKVYVVIGQVESDMLKPTPNARMLGMKPKDQTQINNKISKLGFKPLDSIKIRKMGIDDYNETSTRILELK